MTSCHHCGQRFLDNETRILIDVGSGGAPPQRIALHEVCVFSDTLARGSWLSATIERVRERPSA